MRILFSSSSLTPIQDRVNLKNDGRGASVAGSHAERGNERVLASAITGSFAGTFPS